jgi:hypothetical protein
VTGKPTAEELGIDLTAQQWHCSGEGDGSIEIAIVSVLGSPARPRQAGSPGVPGLNSDWILMRVAGDPAGRVLVYDRQEWDCFLDGARNGEFDDALPGKAPATRLDGSACGGAGRALGGMLGGRK